jgi:hypothetical protein
MGTALAKKDTKLATKPAQTQLLTQDKIEALQNRVRVAIEPHVDKQKLLAKQIAKLEITDQATYDKAADLRKAILGNADDAVDIVEPIITLAHSLHKGLTGVRKSVLDLRDLNKRSLDTKLSAWDMKVRQEQERRDRIAREQAEAEELDRKRQAQIEADKKAEDARIAQDEADEKNRLAQEELDKAKQSQDPEAAAKAQQAAIDAQAASEHASTQQTNAAVAQAVASKPVDVSHVKAAPVFVASAGPSWVDNWKGRVTNFEAAVKYIVGIPQDRPLAHPELLSLIAINETTLNSTAKAQHDGMAIPGLEAYNAKFLR